MISNKKEKNFEMELAPALYVLNKLKDKDVSMHKLFKILYFADRHHISKFGFSFTCDNYIAMEDGPVPTYLYDYIKVVGGRNISSDRTKKELKTFFSFNKPVVKAMVEPEMDYLSKSAIKSLDFSITNNSNKNWATLRSESHDFAWSTAWYHRKNSPISTIDMAKAVGVNAEMLKYIKEST